MKCLNNCVYIVSLSRKYEERRTADNDELKTVFLESFLILELVCENYSQYFHSSRQINVALREFLESHPSLIVRMQWNLISVK